MKFLKFILIFLVIIAILGFIAIKVISEEKPTGKVGTEANTMAHTMLKALNKEAFDSIPYLSFEFFRGGHKYLWDKLNEKVIIEWGENKVIMDLNSISGLSFVNGKKQEGKAHQALIDKAWSYWCNDSFWMIAPFKVFDPGTKRSIVNIEEGAHGLMIEYSSGGVTPGDSYLWILDENHIPTGWKMWTKILPVKGAYNSWEGWQSLEGAQLSMTHSFFGKNVSMKNVKVGHSFEEFGFKTDPFVG